MKNLIINLIFISFALFGAIKPSAAATLDMGTPQVKPMDSVQFLEDASGLLEYADLDRADIASRFQPWPAQQGDINFGYSKSAYWLKIKLKRTDQAPERWLLEIPFLLLDEIDFYASGQAVLHLGTTRPASNAPYFHRFHLMPLDLSTEDKTFVLRVKTSHSTTIPLQVWQPDAFGNQSQKQFILQALYFGGLIALLIYNLFLAVSLRDARFLFYSLFVSHIGMGMLAGNGLGHLFVWREWQVFEPIAQSFFLSLATGFGLLFSNRFLQMRRETSKMAHFNEWAAAVFFGIAAWLLASLWLDLDRQSVVVIFSLVCIPAGLTVLSMALRAWRQGYKAARFFLLAWGILWIGAFVAVLRGFGWLPTNGYTAYSLQISSAAEMLLLALSLADLIHTERQERENAQAMALSSHQRMLESLRLSEERLEMAVQQRTLELEQSLNNEKQTLTQYVRFGALISHEFRNPLGIVESQISLMRREADMGTLNVTKRLDVIASATQRLLSMFEKWLRSDRLNKSLQDFRMQPIPLAAWLRELIDSQMSYHANHQLTLHMATDPGEICGDDNLLEIALINLIDNACNYSAPGSEIHIDVRTQASMIGIAVTDHGCGIELEHQTSIFEDYFRIAPEGHVRGMGLGLAFVRRIVDMHQGQLELVSNIGVGSCFCIWLPSQPQTPAQT